MCVFTCVFTCVVCMCVCVACVLAVDVCWNSGAGKGLVEAIVKSAAFERRRGKPADGARVLEEGLTGV